MFVFISHIKIRELFTNSCSTYRARGALTIYNYRRVVRTLVRIGSVVLLEFDITTIEIAVRPKMLDYGVNRA